MTESRLQSSNPSGWSSFLTWRRAVPEKEDDTVKSISKQSNTNASKSRVSKQTPLEYKTSPSRIRAPIPFQVDLNRSIASYDPKSHLEKDSHQHASSSSESLEDFEEADRSATFENLARVKQKDDLTHSKGRSMRLSKSSPSTDDFASVGKSPPNKTVPGGWLAWGTSTFRSTVHSSFAPAEPSEEDASVYIKSEAFQSPRPSFATIEKRWTFPTSDKIDQCVDRMLAFAGIDGESRSIVTLSIHNLPPSDQIPHDEILARILLRTQPIVENPGGYTLILFASAADLTNSRRGVKTVWPGWTWCWKAWRTLGRSYRKNLKRLYIVHPTRFTTTLVRLISTGSYFISPKFAKKIVHCDNLEALHEKAPVDQLDIPPEVLMWDLNLSGRQDVDLIIEKKSSGLPFLVQDCIKAIQDNSDGTCRMDKEGIFRVSPSIALLRAAKYAYSLKRRPSLDHFAELDNHLPAALLKEFLRSMPSPLFSASTYPVLEKCPSSNEEEAIQYIRESILPLLRQDKLTLLNFVIHCLHGISLRSEKNLMDALNLATVLTPNLIQSEDAIRDVMMCRVQQIGFSSEESSTTTITTSLGTIIALCISRYYEIFDELDVEMPTFSFDSINSKRRDSVGTQGTFGRASSRKQHYLPARLTPSSPIMRQNAGFHLNDTVSPPSPTSVLDGTLKTKKSSNSLRIKSRIASGGSFRNGVSMMDKSDHQLVALVDASACGEFDRNFRTVKKATSADRRESLVWIGVEGDENEDVFKDALAGSPILQQIADVNTLNTLQLARHDRRPLSEVFEE